MRSLAHVVSPVRALEGSELALAQPLTFESMRRARARAEAFGIRVELWTATHARDCAAVPGFADTAPLERTLMDIGRFPEDRPVPLIGDLLERLSRSSDAAYFVYTNVDIVLRPDFYLFVDRLIDAGADAMCLHRRTVFADGADAGDLDALLER